MANTKKDKTWLWVVLAILIVFLILTSRHVTIHIKDQTPVNLEEVIEDLTPEEIEYYENRLMFTTNYYANEDDSGIMLQEMKIDYFVDNDLTTENARSVIMQYTENNYSRDILQTTTEVNNYWTPKKKGGKGVYFYDRTATQGDVVSWESGDIGTTLSRGNWLIFKVDDKPIRVKLTGKEPRFYIFDWIISYDYYQYGKIFKDLMNASKNNTSGASCYVTMNFSKFFTAEEYVDELGGWYNTAFAKELILDAVVKINYNSRGAQTASDSLAKIIKNDKDFDIRPYTINFFENKADNETPVTYEFAYDTKNIYLPNPNFEPNEGYIFSNYFNTSPNGTGESYTFGLVDMERGQTLNLYAQWMQKAIPVWFIDRASGESISQDFYAGLEQNLQLNTFTREGFNFIGWNTESDGSGTAYIDGQALLFEEYRNVFYLYAQWELITNEAVDVAIGDNIRGRTLQITLYSTTSDGGYLLKFKDNSTDYISISDDGENLGYKGYGIFSDIEVVGDEQNTYTISIPDDKDYIVDYIAKDLGVLSALIS